MHRSIDIDRFHSQSFSVRKDTPGPAPGDPWEEEVSVADLHGGDVAVFWRQIGGLNVNLEVVIGGRTTFTSPSLLHNHHSE